MNVLGLLTTKNTGKLRICFSQKFFFFSRRQGGVEKSNWPDCRETDFWLPKALQLQVRHSSFLSLSDLTCQLHSQLPSSLTFRCITPPAKHQPESCALFRLCCTQSWGRVNIVPTLYPHQPPEAPLFLPPVLSDGSVHPHETFPHYFQIFGLRHPYSLSAEVQVSSRTANTDAASTPSPFREPPTKKAHPHCIPLSQPLFTHRCCYSWTRPTLSWATHPIPLTLSGPHSTHQFSFSIGSLLSASAHALNIPNFFF